MSPTYISQISVDKKFNRTEWNRAYRKKNPEKIREIQRRYRAKHKERITERRRQERKLNSASLDEAKRAWVAANPDLVALQGVRRRMRKMHGLQSRSLKFNYGINLENYREILSLQKNVCLICGKDNKTVKSDRLVVDHCHETSRIRGLLCHRCNCGIGYFKDNIHLMNKAIAYLTHFASCDDSSSWPQRVASFVDGAE